MTSADGDARLAQLAERYSLPERAESALRTLVSLLATDPAAPTGVRGERTVLDDHLADSLVALELDEVRSAREVADIGSGAGLPGLVLAAALPEASVWLIESSGRKCAYLERARIACGLDNAYVTHVRAELWTDGFGRCDLVTARALAPLPVVAEYAAPLLMIGGASVAWRGSRDPEQEAAAAKAAAELGLEPQRILKVQPYADVRNRHLHLMLKVRETPERFPRRPGVASRRPLGTRAGSNV